LFVSVSKITCPVNGEPGLVEDVQTVTAEIVLAIFACVTALSASFAVATAPAAIFAVVTALSTSCSVLTDMFGEMVRSAHVVPFHCQVFPAELNKSFRVGESGKSIGITKSPNFR